MLLLINLHPEVLQLYMQTYSNHVLKANVGRAELVRVAMQIQKLLMFPMPCVGRNILKIDFWFLLFSW